MNKLVFLLLSQLVLILLELALGNLGWRLPLALLGALYITLSMGRNWGFAAALTAGAILGVLYGGGWNLLRIIAFPLLSGAVSWWIEQHDDDVNIRFWQPGALAGVVAAVPAWASMFFFWSESGVVPAGIYMLLWQIVWTSAVSAPLFMGFIFMGEMAAEYLGLPRFLPRKGGEKR